MGILPSILKTTTFSQAPGTVPIKSLAMLANLAATLIVSLAANLVFSRRDGKVSSRGG